MWYEDPYNLYLPFYFLFSTRFYFSSRALQYKGGTEHEKGSKINYFCALVSLLVLLRLSESFIFNPFWLNYSFHHCLTTYVQTHLYEFDVTDNVYCPLEFRWAKGTFTVLPISWCWRSYPKERNRLLQNDQEHVEYDESMFFNCFKKSNFSFDEILRNIRDVIKCFAQNKSGSSRLTDRRALRIHTIVVVESRISSKIMSGVAKLAANKRNE